MHASKKRKLEHNECGDSVHLSSLLSTIASEVDLEIDVRKRLMDTLDSRIAWAVVLKEVLQNNGHATADTLHSVAFDALRVADERSDMILSHGPLPPLSIKATEMCPPPPPKLNNMKLKPSFLFIRSSTLLGVEANGQDIDLYLLKCPGCSKTSFISLQGLLNHGRLVHNFEWGSHEECITACSTLDNSLDMTCGTEVGLGPTGIMPGLRNIFQMAVGTRKAANGRAPTLYGAISKESTTVTANSLNQTLGLHDESPALAQFLGKKSIRRQINVLDERFQVNIEHLTSDQTSSSRSWRMRFAHRHSNDVPRPMDHPIEPLNTRRLEMPDIERFKSDSTVPGSVLVTEHSRFHLVSRIIITDRSLWIPPEERNPDYGVYTHKWMVSIVSPSYTYHITSILNSIKVTSSDPNIRTPVPPMTTSPPYVVIGLADRPFLARITLSFCGVHPQNDLASPEQIFFFDHWVDLFPLPVVHIVKGQDQMVDIDLDKNTILKPPQYDFVPIESKSLWGQPFEAASARDICAASLPPNSTEKYEEMLAAIVKRFPLTLEDFKGKRSGISTIPYMLASSMRHFSTFVTGRRKAIEWGRSRAIHDAYKKILADSSDQELIPLSVADVYFWLSEHGHFPKRGHGRAPFKIGDNHLSEEKEMMIWCQFCGLDTKLHDEITLLNEKDRQEISLTIPEPDRKLPLGDRTGSRCTIVAPELQITKFPRVEIRRLLLPKQAPLGPFITPNNMDLLAVANPSITLSVCELTRHWNLHTFSHPELPTVSEVPLFPLDMLGRNKLEVEKHTSSHALLAVITEQFIRALIHRGLEVANRDKLRAVSALSFRTRGRSPLNSDRMLTPTHILSGIYSRALGREAKCHPLDSLLLFSLSKLGVAVDDDDIPATNRQGKSSSEIREED